MGELRMGWFVPGGGGLSYRDRSFTSTPNATLTTTPYTVIETSRPAIIAFSLTVRNNDTVNTQYFRARRYAKSLTSGITMTFEATYSVAAGSTYTLSLLGSTIFPNQRIMEPYRLEIWDPNGSGQLVLESITAIIIELEGVVT